MSDSEGNATPTQAQSTVAQHSFEDTSASHATTGGKSLEALKRPQYKSWRKKFRKMKIKFDGVLEENKKMFKDEQKLEGIARRLREELDGLLELCLDLNQNPALPTDLRYNISLPKKHTTIASIPSVVPEDVTPQAANEMLVEYTQAVQRGQIPHLDLHVIREQIEEKLAAQGVPTLAELESSVPHTRPELNGDVLPDDVLGLEPPGFLTSEQEDAYLLRLDAKCGDQLSLTRTQEMQKDGSAFADDKHWAELTPREVERLFEIQNPQSQHNWLRAHGKGAAAGVDADDNESLAEIKPATGRGGSGKRNLAKQVGDRAVGRAREGFSPGAASAGLGDDDELSLVDDHPVATVSAKKRGRGNGDSDSTYRVKGGKSNGSAAKGKRKRTSGDDPISGGSGKKSKVEAAAE
ncbi:hypothetical protein TI39_contig520g00004 [Zymoseptoria brevis]|uniref:IEC3 subunit of the Ino80 complex, chromatin re-modelling-domain-containing protein n=1 Tax=Zymoseptoria brevis TaxID=1047168 RepID=A0A0F4GM11_9PEZI|nr:hypothetical protein TI39_contig520g00004 [Zymoseptoria brevis]